MSNVNDAAERAADVAAEVTEAAVTDATTGMEVALENAEARAEAAEELAEDIAEAALESERGRRILELEEKVGTWQLRAEELESRQAAMQSEMADLRAQLATPTILAPSIPTTLEPEQSSPLEEVAEALEEVTDPTTEIVVGLEDLPAAENPAPVVKRKSRWLR